VSLANIQSTPISARVIGTNHHLRFIVGSHPYGGELPLQVGNFLPSGGKEYRPIGHLASFDRTRLETLDALSQQVNGSPRRAMEGYGLPAMLLRNARH
jgi:hypothetical protein